MFSLMTALLSPKVMDTLEQQKDTLFELLHERAGVLCVQPSSNICMLQGEWECMKKAHNMLEDFCLRVQEQNSVQALIEAREKAYQDMQNNYQKMAEEAIRGLGPQNTSPSLPQDEDSTNHELSREGSEVYKPNQEKIIREIQERAALATQQQQRTSALIATVGQRDSGEGSPQASQEERTLINGSKEEMEEEEQKSTRQGSVGSSTAAEGSVDHEDDKDSDMGLQIATSDDEDMMPVNGPGKLVPSNGMEAAGPFSPSFPPGLDPQRIAHMENNFPRQEINPNVKPDINQLRAMAQFYAVQQSMLNYNYMSGEARKVLEARMSSMGRIYPGGMPFPGQPLPLPPDAGGGRMMRSPLTSPTYGMAPTDLSVQMRRPNDIKGNGEREGDKPPDSQDGPFAACFRPNGGDNVEEESRQMMPTEFPGLPPVKLYNGGSALPTSHPGAQTSGPYECPACLSTFPSRDAVQEHMLQAHAVGPGLSGAEQKLQGAAIGAGAGLHLPAQPSHSQAMSAAAMSDAYCCPVCGKFYKSGQRLREHILLHDKNYQRPQYPCPTCGKTFTYRHNMKVHFQKIHKGKQPVKRHECSICGQRFHKPVYLRHHLLRHKEALYTGYSGAGEHTPQHLTSPPMPELQPEGKMVSPPSMVSPSDHRPPSLPAPSPSTSAS